MKRLLIAAGLMAAVLAASGTALAQSPAPMVSAPVCLAVQVGPNAGAQGDPARYPDALTWLGIALPANAIVSATVVACPGAAATASGAPAATPAPAESCAIRYQGHDATITFMGAGAKAMCAAYPRANGQWREYTDNPPGGVACVGSYQGLFWFVTDSGGKNIGNQACGGLNQYVNGGTLAIP
jgi:hypothetical protein